MGLRDTLNVRQDEIGVPKHMESTLYMYDVHVYEYLYDRNVHVSLISFFIIT